MRLQCPNCEHQINTEDSSVEVMPPDDAKNNMHAYRCPGCHAKVDFLDWRALTSSQAQRRKKDAAIGA